MWLSSPTLSALLSVLTFWIWVLEISHACVPFIFTERTGMLFCSICMLQHCIVLKSTGTGIVGARDAR
jgi:hypothetical protein